MSMLTRKGTLVRKHRTPLRKHSVRRTRSGGSTTSSTAQRTTEDDDSSVPPSPITKFDPRLTPKSSPSRSYAGTVVSFDDHKQLFRTSIDWSHTASVDTAVGRQDTTVQLEELAKEADSICEFMCRVGKIVCLSDVIIGLLGVSLILPVAMVTVGVKFLEDCPLEPRVPVYLLVGGCVLILKLTLCLWRALQRRRQDSGDSTFDDVTTDAGLSSRTYRFMDVLLSLFLLSWHVTGTYWLFSIWKPRFSPLLHVPSEWCDRTLYLFTVGQNLSFYCLVCLYCVSICCIALVYKPLDRDGIR